MALSSLELLVGYELRDKRYELNLLLGREAILLPHFPVRGVEVHGESEGFWDVNPALGVIYPDYRNPTNLSVSYSVGYPDGTFPALIKEAVTLLARDWLAGNDTDSEEVKRIVESCRWSRERLRESINGR